MTPPPARRTRPPRPQPLPERGPRWIDYVALDDLVPARRNPKQHEVESIRDSFKAHGYADAILLDDRTGRIVSGHGRAEALAVLRDGNDPLPDGLTVDADGRWLVPVVRGWASRDDKHAEAYLVAANRLTELGGWNEAELLDLLAPMADDLALLASAGYDQAALDQLLARVTTRAKREAREARDPDVMPAPPPRPRTRPGDIWHLGAHRLVCGDATDPDVVAAALDGRRIDLTFTSPPYNVGVDYDGHDDRTVPWTAYGAFLAKVVHAFLPHLGDGRAVCWNIGTSPDTYHHRQYALLEDLGLTYLRTCVWQKVGVPVPLWHNTEKSKRARVFTPNYTHELVAVFSRGDLADPEDADPQAALAVFPARRLFAPDEAHDLVAVFASGKRLKSGRAVHFTDTLRNDVFQLHQTQATAGMAVTGGQRTGAQSNLKTRAAKGHPAPFPVSLPEAFIAHLADLGALVYDPFGGSASTLLACEYTGRVGAAVELAPKYCDVAAARWQRLTDEQPILERDGDRKPVNMQALIDTAPDDVAGAPG